MALDNKRLKITKKFKVIFLEETLKDVKIQLSLEERLKIRQELSYDDDEYINSLQEKD